MKKVILGGLAVLIVVLGGAAYYLLSNLDSLVKKAIETVGTEVAGVPVRVSTVKISLSDGVGTLSGLSVGNPSGYKSANAFTLGQVSLSLDTGSLTKNPVVIRQILVSAPEVTYELGANGGNNIQTIQNNVQAFAAKNQAAGGDKSASSSGQDKKLVVSKLDITNGKVTLATPIPGVKGTAGLADIHMTNLGKDSGGATPDQIAQKVIAALTQSAMKASASMGISGQLDAAKGALDKATKGAIPTTVPTAPAAPDAGKALDGLKGAIGK